MYTHILYIMYIYFLSLSEYLYPTPMPKPTPRLWAVPTLQAPNSAFDPPHPPAPEEADANNYKC